jgi:hypothetical protein
MLIVNADDLGGHSLATDRILDCFDRGVITSATAMVHMADSERAAELAAERGLPIGLHLNLTEPFNGADVPEGVRQRQRRVAGVLRDVRANRFSLRTDMLREVAAAVNDQLVRFRDTFGREPTHVDGHQHVHLSPTVLLSLPRSLRVRPGRECDGGIGLPLRRLRTAVLDWRHGTVRRMYAIESLHPELGGHGLDQALELARVITVEIGVHPHRPGDWSVLCGADWTRRLAGVEHGSYARLVRG